MAMDTERPSDGIQTESGDPPRLVVLSGQSGSGKSVALHELEDAGYYCIDNLPPDLLENVIAKTLMSRQALYHRLAVGIDARSHDLDLTSVVEQCRRVREQGVTTLVMFLHTAEDVLIRRYSETRRRHPLTGGGTSLLDAIRQERDLLAPLSEQADLVVDTSRKTVHELRSEVRDRVTRHGGGSLVLLIESFAYRDGVPLDADLVFDARCLPNPHWEAGLRDRNGNDPAVRDYLERFSETREFVQDIAQWVGKWLPAYETQNRSYFTVAVGCTGGRHRSVYVSEALARLFAAAPRPTLVRHLKLDPGNPDKS
jgi:UPF0042 nucleotide-binding protein